MSPEILVAAVGAILNGAVTWGIVSTKIAWLRRDVDELRAHAGMARPRVG